jgi:DNA-binding CsgD family transcriptional regulator
VRKSKPNAKRLFDVSARLGDAVIDPALWSDVMQEICTATNCLGAALVQGVGRTPDIPRTAGVDEAFRSYFNDGWHTRDPRDRGVPLLLAGEMVVTDQDIFTSEEMRRSAFFDFLASQGLGWFAAVGFRSGSDLWALSIQRRSTDAPFDAADKCALAQLSQRLTETATLSKAVGHLVLTSVTNALTLVGNPALAIDRLGFILEINAAAENVFDDDIRVSNRRLLVRDQKAQRALDSLINRLRATPDTQALLVAPIVVQCRAKGPLLIQILPIDGAARSPFLGARALLLLTDFSAKRVVPADVLAATFDLSTAEAKLAAIIAKGHSLDEAAEQLGIARETARNQLKAVFAKTGAHRQSELVALLSRISVGVSSGLAR